MTKVNILIRMYIFANTTYSFVLRIYSLKYSFIYNNTPSLPLNDAHWGGFFFYNYE